ncbi:MAG TPA: lysylphosphatidylglycerol synthase transmembrane domain-containing protein [Bradyrhizobium sp.]|nr:lysylphosphatidylglycerol synthase transmembrane domain-containing protein [Stellaceae bacterium]HUO00219.1 lysylphosphatidylglycerol synthase transmembrane domain-containing protein [Bradyrhizobium sp.]
MARAALDPERHRAARPVSRSPDFGREARSRFAPWISGLLTLAAMVLVVVHFGTLEEFARLVVAIQPAWFLLALAAQAGTYVSASLSWAQTLRRAGHPRPLSLLVPLGIAKLFTDQVVPSGGVSGAVLVTRALTRRGVPANAAMAVLLVGLVSYFAAYLLAVMTSLLILWLHHRANAALFSVVGIFIVIVVAIPSGVLWMKARGPRLLTSWVKRLPGAAQLLRAISDAPTDLVRDPRLLAQTVPLELAVFALDALTLWLVIRGLGQDPPLWVAAVSFIMASVAATLGPIPLGLGTFEAANVGMLHMLGTTIEAGLTATLILRGLTFWLPMLPGLYLARREIGPRRRSAP